MIDPDTPIFAADRTDGGTHSMIEVMPNLDVCIALERDAGPLKQVTAWTDREGLLWWLNEAQRALNAMDRARVAQKEAA